MNLIDPKFSVVNYRSWLRRAFGAITWVIVTAIILGLLFGLAYGMFSSSLEVYRILRVI
jgi:hypothetical protein